jgi:hypothetical protein
LVVAVYIVLGDTVPRDNGFADSKLGLELAHTDAGWRIALIIANIPAPEADTCGLGNLCVLPAERIAWP